MVKLIACGIFKHTPLSAPPSAAVSSTATSSVSTTATTAAVPTTVASSSTSASMKGGLDEKKPVVGSAIRMGVAIDTSSFSYFGRGIVSEHIRFALRAVAERTPLGGRHTVGMKDNPFLVHGYTRYDGLCGMVVTDLEYPQRAAHTLIARQLATFDKLNPTWSSSITNDIPYDREVSWMVADLKDWQDPSSQDKITKIQRELDEIKEIMAANIELVIARGESLNELMAKSEDLSASSRAFHRKTVDYNRCCKLF